MEAKTRRRFFEGGAIRPEGWLRRQLELEAEGQAGNLDKFWPDVKDSAWIGGAREGWERVPYWLDGFIPLAFLLDDGDRKARAKRYIDAILAGQRRDGWICPCKTGEIPKYDTWAVLLISKVLTVWYRYTADDRIPQALYDLMRNYYGLLKDGTIRLFDWGKYRWFEGFVALNFLYERYREDWIPDLARILRDQGEDYETETPKWVRPRNEWTFETHVVNLAMMVKSECVSCGLLGEEYTDRAGRLLEVLDRWNGMAAGTFTGDECLSGLSPIQGVELCAVVELMYSLEHLYAYTGDAKWAERLEKIAFNALPATVSDDMWTHQYDQMTNQIACVKFPGRSLFRTNDGDAHLFGLEPNYGCCTANHGQGWPKLAGGVFLRGENEIHAALPLPARLDCDLAEVLLETEYPFRSEARYTVAAKKPFRFTVRVPSFAGELRIDGAAAENPGEAVFDFAAGERRTVEISWKQETRLVTRPYGLAYAQWGSLVFALPVAAKKTMLEYEKKGVERKFPYCDWELEGTSEWRYGLVRVKEAPRPAEGDRYPFSSEHPPLRLEARLRRVEWETEDGFDAVCAKTPADPAPVGPEETLELVPYGCAKLRMTELPIVPPAGA